jgi:diaminopimelate dehydrogenase
LIKKGRNETLKTKIAISSWGNIGKAVAKIHDFEAQNANHDIELVGIIRRSASGGDNPRGAEVVSDVSALTQKPDVILCSAPSHCVMDDVQKYLRMGISTVDCFDNHKEILKWRETLDALAKKHQAVSVIGSGWDPGFDSLIRALSGLVVTGNNTVTTFGPGRSMGHTTTVKAIHPDITEAVSITLPGKEPGLQRREVFIALNEKLKDKFVQEEIRRRILEHSYFKNDDTQVSFVDSIAAHDTNKSGGTITRCDDNANVELKLHGDNALMTAAAMYGAARAAARICKTNAYGCKTLAEIAPIDFICGETIAERLEKIKY